MGIYDDISAWLVLYIIRPAIDAFKRNATNLEKQIVEIIFVKFNKFFNWVATLDTTVKGYIDERIDEVYDDLDGGGWDLFGWLDDIVDGVFDAIENIFVKTSQLSTIVTKILVDWWADTRDILIDSFKDSFVAVADFAGDVISIIGQLGYITIDVVTGLIVDSVESLTSMISTVVKDVSEALSDVTTSILSTVEDVVDAALSFLTNNILEFFGFINELTVGFTDFLLTTIKEINEVFADTIPGIVESMFDWAKPIIGPIMDAVGFLGQIAGIFTGSHPKEQIFKDTENEQKRIQKKIDDIFERGF